MRVEAPRKMREQHQDGRRRTLEWKTRRTHALLVVDLLLGLDDAADAALDVGVADHHEGPRLRVGPARRSACQSSWTPSYRSSSSRTWTVSLGSDRYRRSR